MSKSTFFQNIKTFIESRSMLVKVLDQRMDLLKGQIAKTQTKRNEYEGKPQSKRKIPKQNDLASTWPEDIKIYAQEVAYNVLKAWSRQIKQAGKHFAVLYVPKGSKGLKEDFQQQHTFKGWLWDSCKRLNIPLLDPTRLLLQAEKEGVEVYRDHLTSDGHKVMTEFLREWLRLNMPALTKQGV